MANDTIAAIATGAGGGIGIVRVSGPEAPAMARRLLKPWPERPESHRLYLATFCDPATGEALDEGLACAMRAPHSYTGEEVLELQGHGGAGNLARLVDAVVRAGARVAEPGEFTRRAFLAGRMDLTQAEAVAEVIAARSERAVRLAQTQRGGAIAARVGQFRRRAIDLLAEVEAQIDFPDEKLDFLSPAVLAQTTLGLASEVAALAGTYARGRLIASGAEVALIGRPNAGKSSLLNALVGEERALTDAVPGTTRDGVEVELELEGWMVRLVDTAGERVSELMGLEQRGIELGRRRRERADVWLIVVDGTVGWTELEERLLGEAARPVVTVWNKCDLAPSRRPNVVVTSARSGEGLGELKRVLRETLNDGDKEESAAISSARQHEALEEAGAALSRVTALLEREEPLELSAVDLRMAIDRLGRVTGEIVDGEVLDQIFARFCIGK